MYVRPQLNNVLQVRLALPALHVCRALTCSHWQEGCAEEGPHVVTSVVFRMKSLLQPTPSHSQ